MKLPIKVLALLVQIQDEQVPHLASIIRRHKANDESLPTWFTDKPAAYYEGLLDACYATIEQLLMAYNCYGGYGHIGLDSNNPRRYNLPR